MAGASSPELAIAVAEAGGMGAAGVLLDDPERIAAWAARFRAGSAGPFQLNVWVPDPLVDDPGGTAAATAFLHRFGAPGPTGPDAPAYTAQCAAMLEAAPTAVSSIIA